MGCTPPQAQDSRTNNCQLGGTEGKDPQPRWGSLAWGGGVWFLSWSRCRTVEAHMPHHRRSYNWKAVLARPVSFGSSWERDGWRLIFGEIFFLKKIMIFKFIHFNNFAVILTFQNLTSFPLFLQFFKLILHILCISKLPQFLHLCICFKYIILLNCRLFQ